MGKKIYTVAYLLDKQPKAFRKLKHYQLMVSFLQNSPDIMKIRFNRRCYSLLNDAVIKPKHLDNFYRTYKLPRNPFFPLFFMLKKKYLREKENKKLEKHQYIEEKMMGLPPYIQRYFTLIRELEQKYNGVSQNPVFMQNLCPKTKKQANLFAGYEHADWICFFEKYLNVLSAAYERISSETIDSMSACLILNCIPQGTADFPDSVKINNRYRNFCKIYHPDAGGDQELFVQIKWARDFLLGEL